jgi:hypothetical protein
VVQSGEILGISAVEKEKITLSQIVLAGRERLKGFGWTAAMSPLN